MNVRHLTGTTIGVAMVAAAQWSAAAEGAPLGEGMGVLTIVFLALGAVVILMQVVPAMVMFGAMLVQLFSPRQDKATSEEQIDQTT